jgi:hypothetical protein
VESSGGSLVPARLSSAANFGQIALSATQGPFNSIEIAGGNRLDAESDGEGIATLVEQNACGRSNGRHTDPTRLLAHDKDRPKELRERNIV